MRIVAAHCSAIYTGRGDTRLGKGLRAIIIKEDGSVSIHNEVGNKPLNYMKGATFTEDATEDALIWTFDCRKESLRIEIDSIVSDVQVALVGPDDEGLVRDGTESQLQEWLAEHPEILGEGYTLVQREYPTGNGPVDLLVKDAQGIPVAVEVKRIAMTNAVDQVRRYVEALKSDDPTGEFAQVRGIIAALDVRPNTSHWAGRKGIQTITIPAWWRTDGADSITGSELKGE